ncbi:MAG: glycosyltransferase [Saprospiraceae bacterium]|nr:glycosyltransferase [Saprospiraceae bacterium]
MSIPRIIHQTWKDEKIPERWKAFQDKVRSLHPDWKYQLWTDEDNDAFIEKHYPDLLMIYRSYPKPVMRADVIRYAIMDRIGGLYLDLDYEMLRPFDLLDAHIVLPKSRSANFGDKEDRIGNCIMASEPGHDFWKVVIQDLITNPFKIGIEELDVEKATGPLLLTRIYEDGKWPDIDTPERLLFHPPSPRSRSEYEAILKEDISYGIHHAHGSWRQPRWRKLLAKILGSS